MKRDDLTAGETYVADDGRVYEVVDLTPGWTLRNGEWVADPGTQRRFIRGKGWVDYAANNKIKVLAIREGTKAVIEPRYLTMTLKDHEAQEKTRRKEATQKQRQQKEITATARKAGVKINSLDIDLDRNRVVLTVDDFVRLIGGTEVSTT